MTFRISKIQPTPNPNATKFVLDGQISDQPTSFLNAASAGNHPVASRLFAIPGVNSVLLLGDFVTINKTPEANWSDITSKVEQALASI